MSADMLLSFFEPSPSGFRSFLHEPNNAKLHPARIGNSGNSMSRQNYLNGQVCLLCDPDVVESPTWVSTSSSILRDADSL